jgi:hypothetical protein
MTETVDQLIEARFDAVARPTDDGDWGDVLARGPRPGRARRTPARLLLAAAVVALAAGVTAVAFAGPGTFIDFFTSPPAPETVKDFFGAQNVTAPAGQNPEAVLEQARKIMSVSFDADNVDAGHPTLHTLYVAPKKSGGFCYLWTDFGGGCVDPNSNSMPAGMGPLTVDWLANDYALLVDGTVRAGATKTVEARFADGTTETIPVTWVSAPINAGFFVYLVPTAHQTRDDALTSVVALDAKGDVIGRQDFRLTDPLDQDVMQTLPDGTQYSLPRRADASEAQKVVSFRTTKGSEAYLWVMPRTGGGDCYLTNRSQGCEPPGSLSEIPGAFNGGLAGGADPILFFAQTKSEVAALEFRYQDGESDRVTPVDGFVLTEITPDHYAQGSRLETVVALDKDGNTIDTEPFHPEEMGVYPCEKPVDLGYGAKECP